MKLTETVQSGDWKNEKHVPVIHIENKDGNTVVNVRVGEEIEHPNTLEHHIQWIKVFLQKEGSKFPIEIGSYQFSAHGEDDICTKPCVHACLNGTCSGTIYALSYCNIHGLWENSEEF
ncbi:MAG: class II SORL domain-containing protein [Peptoniphilus sp. oral taxon 375]|uniref:class II SORL domain-containing protein n=1 Tax=Urinicoccus timonensis TaxID=2024205 RepID=UPI00021A3280|nr:class II SORL domain-containing protein [Urinicoccus timonensis]EGS31289.1 superoxide reductase [Peptoniphilus sp. oral taxon 375 str. F0436]MBS4871968.1 class II SORL domain-containing protein [Peptoniphilus sp. oral taxon 375]